MRLASWTFLLMLVMNAVQGYDDESILERLAEEEDIERPHQQQGGWRGGSNNRGGGGGRPTVSSPPAPPLVPDSVHWMEDESPGSPSLRRGGRGRGRTAESSRHSSPPSSQTAVTVAAADEPRKASTPQTPSRQPHHLLPSSVSSTDDRQVHQPKRHKTSRGRLSGSRGLVAHSVCPSQTEWKRLREAKDINNTVVEVFQPSHGGQRKKGGGGGGGGGEMARWTQWFYVVSCRNQVFQSERQCPDCCIGIDHTRYASSCEQRQSYVMAYIRRPWQKKFNWDYILINSGCNCAITSLHEDL